MTVAVCAMGKRPFSDVGARWVDELQAAGLHTVDHRATRVRRDTVIADLNGAVDVVLYIGHGRCRGWSGYQTIRLAHFDGTSIQEPVNAVFAFACDSAGSGTEQVSFGEELVRSGRARAYVGWTEPVPIDAGLRVANSVVAELGATGTNVSVAGLLERAHATLSVDESGLLAKMRIIGDSSTRLAHNDRQLVLS